MKKQLWHLVLFAVVAVVSAPKAGAQTLPAYEVFYLSVGSSDYAAVRISERQQGVNGFGNLSSGSHSAVSVAERLKRSGSPFGITLVSEPGRFVTRRDVLTQLDSLVSAVRRSKSPRPFILYYFAGHGLSEGIGWNHFSIPGDFTFYGSPDRLPVLEMADHAIYTGEIFDLLEKSGIPFLMLLDNCRESDDERFQNPVLSRGAQESLRGASAVIRHLNEFREATPVVFSTAPGTTVPEAEDPTDSSGHLSVGPIGRRLLLMFDDVHRRQRNLTLAQLVRGLTDPTLDTGTRPAVTRSDPTARNGFLIRFPVRIGGRHLERTGSGRTPARPIGRPD